MSVDLWSGLFAALLTIPVAVSVGLAARDGFRGWRWWGLSPVGALILWAAMTYFWLIPPVHRLAIPDGAVHFLDYLSFLVFGLLVWLGAFDFRKGRQVRDWEALKAALVSCDLAWWARHVYSMVCRLAMLPAVAAIWLAGSSAYFLAGQVPPGGRTRHEEQVQPASMMLGFEMLLFCLAVVLALIFVAVADGRARDQA